jgi:hypothetical protein
MRKRSKYRPKKNLIDPVTWVLAGIKPFSEVPYSVTLRIRNHDAMDKLRKGEATKEDMDTLIGAFNMCEGYMRLRPDLGRDWASEIRAGQDALLAVARRGDESNRFILKAEELVAMNLVMEIHDAQLDNTTVNDMEKAMDIVTQDHIHKKVRHVKQKDTNEKATDA